MEKISAGCVEDYCRGLSDFPLDGCAKNHYATG
jgi:hypothetical protein